jgi:hypothetical protein
VLVWQGASLLPSLFQWSEWFSVEAVDANHSRVTMLLTHQGLLAHPYRICNKNRDLKGFQEFAESLKKKAER